MTKRVNRSPGVEGELFVHATGPHAIPPIDASSIEMQLRLMKGRLVAELEQLEQARRVSKETLELRMSV